MRSSLKCRPGCVHICMSYSIITTLQYITRPRASITISVCFWVKKSLVLFLTVEQIHSSDEEVKGSVSWLISASQSKAELREITTSSNHGFCSVRKSFLASVWIEISIVRQSFIPRAPIQEWVILWLYRSHWGTLYSLVLLSLYLFLSLAYLSLSVPFFLSILCKTSI